MHIIIDNKKPLSGKPNITGEQTIQHHPKIVPDIIVVFAND